MAQNDLLIRISGDTKGFAQAMKSVNAELVSADRAAATTSRTFGGLGGALSGVGGAFVGVLSVGALAGFVRGAVDARAQMDSLERGLTAVMKSSSSAALELESLKEVAKLPGLGFQEAVRGSINLQAAGFSAETARRALQGFGNALATVGKGKADLDGVIVALSQIAAKGKISAEEINQMAERVPQIRQIMRDAFGTANTEVLQKMGISSEEFVEKVVTELEKLPKVTGGLQNDMENFSDSWQQAMATLGKEAEPAAQQAIRALSGLADWVKTNGPTIFRDVRSLAGAFDDLMKAASLGTWDSAKGIWRDFIDVVGAAAKTYRDFLNATATTVQRGFETEGRQKTLPGDEAYMRGVASNISSSFKTGSDMAESMRAAVNRVSDSFIRNAKEAKVTAAAHKELSLAMQGPITLSDALAAEVAKLEQADYDAYFRSVAKSMHDIAGGAQDAATETARYSRILSMMQPEFYPSAVGGMDDEQSRRQAAEGLKQLKILYGDVAIAAERGGTKQSAVMREVSTVVTDMSRGIADAIVNGRKLGDVFTNVAKEIASAILRHVIQGAFVQLGKAVMGAIGQLGGLGKVLSGIFGGISSAGSVAPAGGSAVGSVAGSAAGTVGKIAGSAVTGVVGAVAGVVSAVSGIISNFQLARQETTLNAIEWNTRKTSLHAQDTLLKINEGIPGFGAVQQRIVEVRDLLVGWNDSVLRGAASGARGGEVNINFSGAWIGYRDMDSFVDDLVRRIKSKL